MQLLAVKGETEERSAYFFDDVGLEVRIYGWWYRQVMLD